MPLFRRPDGKLAQDVPDYRRIMPYIMRSRTESVVFFKQEIDLAQTLPFIERWNAAAKDKRISVLHVFLYAAIRTLHERPRLNRFVSGGRIYERDGIWISFSAKKRLDDDSPIVVLKRKFDPSVSFGQMVDFLYQDIAEGRSQKKSHTDKEVSLFLKMPGPVLRLGVRIFRWLDAMNLLPGGFIRPDPMYVSLFAVNLGSIKIESAYHHLYEYGNCPIFAAIGRVKKVPVVKDDGSVGSTTVCEVKYTFDERVEDGLYCARALDHLRSQMENPDAWGDRT